MATITRAEFQNQNRDAAFDVAKVREGAGSDALKQRLAAADLDGDGQISGAKELGKLFTAIDTLDRDGSRDSMKLTGPGGSKAPAAKVLQSLDSARTSQAPRRGLQPQTPTDSAASVAGDIKGTVKGTAKGTGYYPDSSAMEGGFVDKRDHKLNTLQAYLKGDAPYVSIALDKNLYKNGAVKYGDTFRIPELEKKYGRPIVFKAVDTGGAFTNKGFGRVDICTASRRDSLDPTVNGSLTLVKQ